LRTLVYTIQNYGEYLIKNLKINKKFIWINNGIDLEEMKKKEPLSQEIKAKLPKNKFIVGYTGTIGIANALDSFLGAAKKLHDKKDILFIIVGDGKEKDKLLNFRT